ncbi:hypothetical protein [Streptomyces goshikiensis]
MHDQEQPDHASGGVPHAYRNVLYWRWAAEMPRPLRRTKMAAVLYALATAANTSGVLRMRDGKEIRVQSVARAATTDLKDCRRLLDAAVAAGIVGTEKAPRIGVPTVYVLLINPRPDWAAAVASLESTKRVRPDRGPAPWADEPADEVGGRSTQPEVGGPPTQEPGERWGDRPPTSEKSGWVDRPPLEVGGPPPLEVGGPPPQRPRATQVLPQDSADVGGQLSPGGASPGEDGAADTGPQSPPGSWPPHLTLTTQQRRDARAAQVKDKSASSGGQMPLLLSVRAPEHVAAKAALREAAEGHPEIVLRAIRELGVRDAVTLYGHRLVHPHLTDQTEPATDYTDTA